MIINVDQIMAQDQSHNPEINKSQYTNEIKLKEKLQQLRKINMTTKKQCQAGSLNRKQGPTKKKTQQAREQQTETKKTHQKTIP
jgi:hypothetical protein